MGRAAGTSHKGLRRPLSGEGDRDFPQRTEVTRGGGRAAGTSHKGLRLKDRVRRSALDSP